MASTAAGYFRRLARRITTDVDTLDASEMSETAEASGAQRACDCSRGEEVTVLGRLRSVEVCPQAAAAMSGSRIESASRMDDLSDGEDWYDREQWGLAEGEDLKKGTDEDEVETVDESRTQGKRGRGRHFPFF